MKKFFFLTIMAICAITASAQADQGFRMGARLDLGLSNVVYEGDKTTFGWGVNLLAEYNFTESVYLQSGLGLQDIAHKEELIEGTLNAYFLQLPIHVGGRFGVGESAQFFIQAGPTLSYGIGGSKIDWNFGGSSKYFDFANRFDIGIGGRLGVEFSNIQISVGANYGMLEAFKEIGGHNLSVNLGVAYMF